MLRRNGGLTKVVAGVCVFLSVCYAIYLYNDLSGQLKITERTAERYRREQESVSAQLKDVNLAKDEFKQRCDSEKDELTIKLGSLQKNYQMLKSQHEDIQTQFSKVQMEKENENNDRMKQDEERAMEYNQFKQEKNLEISSLRDAKANLKREKEQLLKQIEDFKSKLQSSLELIQQAESRQHEAEDRVHQLEKQQLQFGNQQQQQQFDNHVQLNVPQIPQQQLVQNLDGLQGAHSNDPNPIKFGRFDIGPDLGQGHGRNYIDIRHQQQHNIAEGQMYGDQIVKQAKGVGNLADDILKSLQDKQKPIDDKLIEEQQELHQIIPPHDLDLNKNNLGYQKSAQKLSDKDDHAIAQQQLGKPNFDAGHGLHGDKKTEAAGVDGNHDNRIDNQGPVHLQVQEPFIKKGSDVINSKGAEGFGRVKPILPVVPDEQVQPQLPVDDNRREEQIDVPAVQQGNEQLEDANNEKPAAAADDDDDEDNNYENDFDKENNENDDDGDI